LGLETNLVFSDGVQLVGEQVQAGLKAICGISVKIKMQKTRAAYCAIQLGDSAETLSRPRPELEKLGKEGYVLDIFKKGIQIVSGNPHGLFNGTQTLLQLLENGPRLPCLQIQDWPTLGLRGVHLMLAQEMPTFECMQALIRQISRYKINTLLLEYEDKFPYEKYSFLRHPLALNKEQIRALLKSAKEHFIEVIPLLQCFGHVGYILKHPQFSHLRERKDDPYQYCVGKRESLRVFEEMASEILAVHKEGRYFHLGGDETLYLGECPACAREFGRIGKSRFFINHIAQRAKMIRAAGKTPIIWDDQLIWHPEGIDSFPKDIQVMYWDYTTGDQDEAPFIKWDNRTWFGEEVFERIPAETIKRFRKYWDAGRFPQSNRSFPYLRYYKDHGLQVIGAPSVKSGGTGLINSDDRLHLPNIRGFCRKIAEHKGQGIVSTYWPTCGGPLPGLWHGLVATGGFSWYPDETTDSFDTKFAERFFGAKNTGWMKVFYLLGGNIHMQNTGPMRKRAQEAQALLKVLKAKARMSQTTVHCLDLTARMRLHQADFLEISGEVEDKIIRYLDYKHWDKDKQIGNRGSLSYRCPGSGEKSFSRNSLEKMVAGLRDIRNALEPLKKEFKDLYSRDIMESEVDEMLKRLYGEEQNKLEAYLSELNYLLAVQKIEQYINKN